MPGGPALIIMAAGIGSRYGSLKQVEPIGPGGEIVIDYSIYDALQAGFTRVVFLIRRDIEEIFREKVGSHIDGRVETAYVFQDLTAALPPGFDPPASRIKPWGTGHAVLCCQGAVNTPFAVINADDFYGPGAFRALADHLRRAHDQEDQAHGRPILDACMAGYVLENTLSDHGSVARGVCQVTPEGYLAEIHEHTRIEKWEDGARTSRDGVTWEPIPLESTISMNMFGFTTGIFPELAARFPLFLEQNAANLVKAEFYLPEVANALLQEGRMRVRVLPVSEQWYGVTYPEDRPAIQAAIRGLVEKGKYPRELWR
jgi:hypothetical protein